MFSWQGLGIAIDYFLQLGHKDVQAVVPLFVQSKDDPIPPAMHTDILETLNRNGHIVFIPNHLYDAEHILSIAMDKNAVVISNTRFGDFYYRNPQIAPFLQDKK